MPSAAAVAAAVFAVWAVAGFPTAIGAELEGGKQETEGSEGIGDVPDVKNFASWATGLLKGVPDSAAAPSAMAPAERFTLVLAADRTRRPDVLDHFGIYGGGWDINSKHYWASVSFTGVVGFFLAAFWLLLFAIVVTATCCCSWRTRKRSSFHAKHLSPPVIMIITLAVIAGCVLIFFGQEKFHGEALGTLNFVVNQSDFTVQLLRNVTDYLSFARTMSIAAIYLPSDVQQQIDGIKGDLNDAAEKISNKTEETYVRIREILGDVCISLIVVAFSMPVVAVLVYVLSECGLKRLLWMFLTIGWLVVALTFIVLGILTIVNSAAKDTCEAMNEWVQNPQAETALSNLLPCVDEQTTNLTLYQSKLVTVSVVKLINRVISSLVNRRHHGHSSHLMPYLCSPYDVDLNDRQCGSREVSFANASMVWLNFTCAETDSTACANETTILPVVYSELVMAANVSYALYHYAPLLLNLQNCKFVRDTFSEITADYCPLLEWDFTVVSAGLALVASGVALCILWVVFANRPRREEEFALEGLGSNGKGRCCPGHAGRRVCRW